MHAVDYLRLSDIDPADLLPFLNSEKVRKHLMQHAPFTVDTVTAWVNAKLEVDATAGCRVRAIVCDGALAGWCGIQLENESYELAIVIDERFWGLGRQVFNDMMRWAKELGHAEVLIHFLHTRRNYRFLNKIAKEVYQTEMFGTRFTTYRLLVE